MQHSSAPQRVAGEPVQELDPRVCMFAQRRYVFVGVTRPSSHHEFEISLGFLECFCQKIARLFWRKTSEEEHIPVGHQPNRDSSEEFRRSRSLPGHDRTAHRNSSSAFDWRLGANQSEAVRVRFVIDARQMRVLDPNLSQDSGDRYKSAC
jgi:hypothetical protein